MAKRKEKYVIKQGITGAGKDYNVYVLNIREIVTGYIIGFLAVFLASEIMFGVVIASLILGGIVGLAAIPVYKRYLFKKRTQKITLQFRDMLDSLSNSFSAGKNTSMAFVDAYNDMEMAYGAKAIIVSEINIIINGLNNNFTIEDLLTDMALRCGIDDMSSFAQTFCVCNRLGGNLKRVVCDSRDIINDKIEIEMEIETTISSNKNEMNILSILPFFIILMMKTMGNSAITANTAVNVAVKFIAIGMFIVAYIIGQKITDIKV